MKVQQDILIPNKESKLPKKEIGIWKSIQADYQSNQFNSSHPLDLIHLT
jgi:hypothetical protein